MQLQPQQANANDVRLQWDVRLITGDGQVIAASGGNADIPGILDQSQRATAIGVVDNDMQVKVVNPLLARLQELLTKRTLAENPTDISVQASGINLLPDSSGQVLTA